MNMGAILIFIDGTICDTRHRHSLEGTDDFFSDSEILKDIPCPGSIECIRELSFRYKIIYIGARPVRYAGITKEWLRREGYPDGELFLSDTQRGRLDIAAELKQKYNIAAGIGDRWDDNELHLEIGCMSIILKEFEGDWNTVRKYLIWPMNKVFRLASKEDLPSVVSLFKDAITDMCSRGIQQWDDIYPNEQLLRSDIENRQMYVLVNGGIIVSAAVINEEQEEGYETAGWKFEKEKTAVLHRLCVSPACQNRGFGKETVRHAEDIMKAAGYTAVRLDAFSQNPSALRLYEGLGYARAGEVTFRKGRFFLYEKLLRGE